jgi:hypothetical protein
LRIKFNTVWLLTIEIQERRLGTEKASVNVIEFRNAQVFSNWKLPNVKYSTYEQPRKESLKVIEKKKPNSSIHSDNNNQHDCENIILEQKTPRSLMLLLPTMEARQS